MKRTLLALTVLAAFPVFAADYVGVNSAKKNNINVDGSGATGKNTIAIGPIAKADGLGDIAIGTAVHSAAGSAITIGTNSSNTGAGSVVIGHDANNNGNLSIAIGHKAKANSAMATATGSDAQANGESSTAYGKGTRADGKASTAFGAHATGSGNSTLAGGLHANASGHQSTALGQSTHAAGNASTAIGSGANVGKEGRFGLAAGTNATVNHQHGVAIGSFSTATSPVAISSAKVGDLKLSGFAGNRPTSSISVGNDKMKRQLQNVAAGDISAKSTDVTNGSQLYAVAKEVDKNRELINSGFTITADTGSQKVNLGDVISLTGHNGNTFVEADGTGSITVGLSNDIEIGSVTTGNVHMSSQGLNLAGQAIQNVKDGVQAKDAVNLSQLQKGLASVTRTINPGKNIEVKEIVGKDGSRNVIVGTHSVVEFDRVTAGGVVVDKHGIDANGKKITGVMEGVNPSDAVNVSQLNRLTDHVNNNINRIDNDVQNLYNFANDMSQRIEGVKRDSNAGVASAIAHASLPQPYQPGQSMISVGGGHYRGENAGAIGLGYITPKGRFVWKAGASYNSATKWGAGVGVGIVLGKIKPVAPQVVERVVVEKIIEKEPQVIYRDVTHSPKRIRQ